MRGQRILVVGCCGSGKTTFALKLGALTGLPVVHLDKLHHLPNWVPRPREEFDAILLEELQKPVWIIDGNYTRTLPLRLQYCDSVIYFDLPRRVAMRGVLTRAVRDRKRPRPDKAEGCDDRLNWKFIKFTWNFEKTQGAKNKEIVRESGKPVVWLHSRKEARQFTEEVRQK
jgi:adenylate kinase family enzyme